MDARNGRDATKPIDADDSLGELFERLTGDLRAFASTQIELAKLELKDEAVRAGTAGAFLGAGAFAAMLAIALLSAAAAWGLAEIMPAGFAFLIVAVVWGVAAAVFASVGRKRLREIRPVPPETKRSLKEDVEWARQLKS
jgi:hypothetical protein